MSVTGSSVRIMRLLFVHGAGGYDEDRPMAEHLAGEVGGDLLYPRLPDEDMSAAAWRAPLRGALDGLDADDLLVGHSFGASMPLQELAAAPVGPPRATLLAMPCWDVDGWEVPEYALAGPEPSTILSLHHCRDDAVVPFAHLGLHERCLPGARRTAHRTGGHQLEGVLELVAAELVPDARP